MIRNFRIVASVVAILVASSGAWAETSSDIVTAALSSGSERMAIFALSDPRMPFPVRVKGGRLSAERGYDPAGEFGKISGTVDVSPILSYDSDINGGSGKDGFTVGGIDFLIPEDDRRKSGVVIGASAQASSRYTIGRQTVADIGGWGSFAWSPEHEISKISAGVSACVTRQIDRDLYTGACAAYGLYRTDLKDDESVVGEISVNKLLAGEGAIHDIGAGISLVSIRDRRYDEAFQQATGRISGETLLRSGDMIGYGASFGERVRGQKVRTFGLDAFYTTLVGGRLVSLGAAYDDYSGATWLGREVREESFSASAALTLRNGLEIGAEYVKTSSGSQLSDGNEVFFDVRIKF